MKRFLAVLLTVLLSMSILAGCKPGNDKLIIGTWEADVDITEMMKEEIESDEVMAEYVKVPEFIMTMIFEFKEDGTMSLGVDEKRLDESFNKLIEYIKDGVVTYLEAMIAESELEMTVDELLELSNTSLDDMIEEMSKAMKEAMDTEELSYEYNYKVEEDKLYSWEDGEEQSKASYITISFSDDDTLEFVESSSESDNEIIDMIKTLKRVK